MTVSDIALIGFGAVILIILGFAAALLWQIVRGDISLVGLVAEPDDPVKQAGHGKASLSRFQMLIFTFVIAGLYLLLSVEAGAFIDIPANVLGLLGISGGSFVLSKTVGGRPAAPPSITPAPPAEAPKPGDGGA